MAWGGGAWVEQARCYVTLPSAPCTVIDGQCAVPMTGAGLLSFAYHLGLPNVGCSWGNLTNCLIECPLKLVAAAVLSLEQSAARTTVSFTSPAL